MAIKPSQLIQVVIDAIEAETAADQAHPNDAFAGRAGALSAAAEDRAFGVEAGVSRRYLQNNGPDEHEVEILISFLYATHDDEDAHKRVADDQALVSEALIKLPGNGAITNAENVFQIEVGDGSIQPGQHERTIEVVRSAVLLYIYG